jgi:RNA ligase
VLRILNKYHNQGLLYKQVHPTLPLTIWNYSEDVQYGNKWDEMTLMARGLVTDEFGTIVARPFKKFFNMEEGKHTPTVDFEVFEKVDGSLGIVFNYKGEWMIATRGSFTSDQAIKGKEMLDKLKMGKVPYNLTYLFEIIYPENRIVVSYGDVEKLVLLGAINTETGTEVSRHTLEYFASEIGSDISKSYDGIKDYSTLKGMIKDDEEGFIIRFSNGDRMKIKGEEYLRLHKIMTNVSTTAVWEVLSNGGNFEDLLKDVPDEFYSKIKDYEKGLRYNYHQLYNYAGKIHDYFRFGKYNDKEVEPSKKDFALHLQSSEVDPKVKSICFAMWDKKLYEQIIWKLIKPEFKKL